MAARILRNLICLSSSSPFPFINYRQMRQSRLDISFLTHYRSKYLLLFSNENICTSCCAQTAKNKFVPIIFGLHFFCQLENFRRGKQISSFCESHYYVK